MSPTAYPTIRIAACDLNGRMRGKRVPVTVTALPFIPARFKRKPAKAQA